MKNRRIFVVISLFISFSFVPLSAYPGTQHIMLQGFHWKSCTVQQGWHTIIRENAQRIKNAGFDIVWFPPPSASASCQGYEPTQLRNLNSAYGTEDQLREAIRALGCEVQVIADIVINHRSGTSGWADFTNPDWSTYTIVSDDEWGGEKSVNGDLGDSAPFSRDLDHKNPETQDGIKAWMAWLKNDVGFSGWRYDMVKGYPGWAIEIYNDTTIPAFTVGEYLDYDTAKVIGWIDSTHRDWRKRATAFDFPLRRALYQAVAWGNYDWLKYHDRGAGLIGIWSDKAVTFIENHDTEEVRNSAYAPPFPDGDQTLQGYAFILTHPGTPCVFWKDIFDAGPENERRIKQLISIRQSYGIHSESKVWIARAEKGDCYAAYIFGEHGEIAVKIGPESWSPKGSKWDPVGDLLTSGNDYAVWGEDGEKPQ
jgi:alpha-amylase